MGDVLDGQAVFFFNRLKKEYLRISKKAAFFRTDCYRVYDRDIPEIPLTVDVYGKTVRVNDYRRDKSDSAWLSCMTEQILKAMPDADPHIWVKERHSRSSGQYAGRGGGTVRTVSEQGLLFEVDLSGYADTGLFPDHRLTRQLVRDRAEGLAFLNLFSYTGAFTVYAAAGGASKTVSVDLSAVYTDWARRNMALNGLDGGEHRFVTGDCMAFLREDGGDMFDLAVVDPPTFSASKKTKGSFDVQRDHAALLNAVFGRMRRGGTVFFSTNKRSFRLDAHLIDARNIEDITEKTIPFDFKKHRPHRCWEISL